MASEKRLVDANALRKKALADMYTGEMFIYLEDLDEAPTVDAVEVVHAYWIGDEPGEWQCSHCGEYAADGGFEKTRFCPNCGSIMDGERKAADGKM